MNLEEQLKQAEDEVQQVQSQLYAAKNKMREIQRAIVKERFGVELGSIVVSKKGRFKVAGLGAYYGYPGWRPSLDGFKEKKAGGWSERQQWVGSDWSLAE